MSSKSETGCYYPDASPADGRDRNIPALHPCSNSSSGGTAVCCELGDPCIGQKLCGRRDNAGNIVSIYRGGCTMSDDCPDKCTVSEASFFDPRNTEVEVIPCTAQPQPTFIVVCNDDGISTKNCSADGLSIVGSKSADPRQGWVMTFDEVNTPTRIAGAPSATEFASPPEDAAGTNNFTGSRLIEAITIPVAITVLILIICGITSIVLRRKLKKEDSENNTSNFTDPGVPLGPVPAQAQIPLNHQRGGAELEAITCSPSKIQELDSSSSRPTTMWPTLVSHRPTNSSPSLPSPMGVQRPAYPGPRPISLTHSHTLPVIQPISPLSPLESQYYHTQPTPSRPESVRTAIERIYTPWRPSNLQVSLNENSGASSFHDTRPMHRSSTAPGAIWTTENPHPHPLASNPVFPQHEPVIEAHAVSESASGVAQAHQPASAWEDRYTETGPAV